jgi:glycosyltransferase involved in cell wall biosynthesis
VTIALLSAEYPPLPGGVGDYTARLAAALAARGYAIRVLTSRAAVRRAWIGGSGPGWHVQSIAGRWGWGAWPAIVAASAGCDVLHVQYQTAAYGMHPAINLLPLALRRLRPGLRVITTFHDLLPPYLFRGAGPLRHLPAALLAAASHRIVLTTPEALDAPPLRLLRRLAPELLRKVRLIPIGSNLPEDPPPDDDRAAWRARLGVDAAAPLLGFFGFQHPTKGLPTLLRALAHPALRGARLVLIGAPAGASDPTSAAHAAQLDRLAAALGLGERIVRTGFVAPEEAAGYLLAVDLCVLPFAEGASFQRGSLIAALALGVPVLTTAPPQLWGTPQTPAEGTQPPRHSPAMHERAPAGPRRLVRYLRSSPSPWTVPGGEVPPRLVHGTHAWLVPPEDAAALATAARTLLDDPALRARLGAGARELARYFRWERIAEAHTALYASAPGREAPLVPRSGER